MAQYSDKQWNKCRLAYEVEGKSFSALANKYPMSRSSITDRAKRDVWVKLVIPKTAELVAKSEMHATKIRMTMKHTKESVKAISEAHDIIKIRETNLYNNEVNKQRIGVHLTDHLGIHDIHDDNAVQDIQRLAQTSKALDPTQSAVNIDQSTNNTQVNIFSDMSEEDLNQALNALEGRS